MTSQVMPTQPNMADPSFITPVDRLISSLDGVYYKLSEVAEILGRSPTTIRRATKNQNIKAPSYQITQGKNLYYLFTPEDVEELRRHYGNRAPERRHD